MPQPLEVTDRSAGHVDVLILRRAKPIFPTVSEGGRGAGLFSYENELRPEVMQYFGGSVGTELQIANAIPVHSGIYHTRLPRMISRTLPTLASSLSHSPHPRLNKST